MQLWRIILILTLAILCQGCVAFPYPSPEAKGVIIDASTKRPVKGAKIQALENRKIVCETLADGSFDLPAHHHWGFCFLMPGDYLEITSFSINANNYQPSTNMCLGRHDGKPVDFYAPIELQEMK